MQCCHTNSDQSTVIDNVLVDVVSLPLGTDTAGGVMSKIIEHNSRKPCKQMQSFTVYFDNQWVFSIFVKKAKE